jgi:signal transduction histidine kinase
MTITDDGKGFQEERVVHDKKGKRLGLLGMRERLEIVGGNFTVTSAPGKGTTVLAQVPLIDSASLGGGTRSRPNRHP